MAVSGNRGRRGLSGGGVGNVSGFSIQGPKVAAKKGCHGSGRAWHPVGRSIEQVSVDCFTHMPLANCIWMQVITDVVVGL